VVFKEITHFADGSPMNDSLVDGVIYIKSGLSYYVDAEFNSTSSIPAMRFGIFGDGDTDNASVFQKIFDVISRAGGGTAIVGNGVYKFTSIVFIKPGVYLIGAGKTTFTINGTSLKAVFSSDNAVKTNLVQTQDLLYGDTVNNIQNTLKKGDFIRYRSTRRFTTEWDSGTPIRAYYLDGEILKIQEATPEQLAFESAPFLNFPLVTENGVEAYTPSRGGGMTGVILEGPLSDTIANCGLIINDWDGYEIGTITTLNFNQAGIQVNRSMNINITEVSSIGGSDALGLNYGLSINDGCKYIKVDLATGARNRHVIAAGGTGYAIPMYVVADMIVGKNTSTHTADTHANTAFFTYKKIIGTHGFSMSGIGHTVLSTESTGTRFTPAYEGGMNCFFGDIRAYGVSFFYTNKIILNCTFGTVALFCEFNHTAQKVIGFRSGSKNITFDNLRLINTSFLINGTSEANTSPLTVDARYGMIVQEGWRINNYYASGFPVGISIQNKNVMIGHIHLENCGWNSSLTSGNESAILINSIAENATISGGLIEITAPSVLISSVRYLRFLDGPDCLGITIGNIKAKGRNFPFGAYIPANYKELLQTLGFPAQITS